MRDNTPPVITPLGWKDGEHLGAKATLSLTVTDNLGSAGDFRAELDGKWLMFRQKGDEYTYDLDEHFGPGEHVLKVSVSDEAGNATVRTYRLIR
jgi:hypothetical protein